MRRGRADAVIRCAPWGRSCAARRRRTTRCGEAAGDPDGRRRPRRLANDLANAAARPRSARAGRAADDWNLLSVAVDSDVIRPTLNHGIDFRAGATEDRMGFGPIALYVGLRRGAVQGPGVQGPPRQDLAGRSRFAAASACSGSTTSTMRGAPAPATSIATACSTSCRARTTTSVPTTPRATSCTWRRRRVPPRTSRRPGPTTPSISPATAGPTSSPARAGR